MINKFTYKQKNRLLLIVSLLLLLVAYQLAFKQTIDLYFQGKTLKSKINNQDITAMQIAQLQYELSGVEAMIDQNKQMEGTSFQERILETVSRFCNKHDIVLSEFSEPTTREESGYYIETNIVSVKGSFVKLVKLVAELEEKQQVSKVVSTHYFTKKDNSTKREELSVTIYLQNVIKLNHEE